MEKKTSKRRRISFEHVRAIVYAVIDNPMVMAELSNQKPGLANRIFKILFELRPAVSMSVLYRVVLGLERADALHRLVDHAIISMKVDDLWCVVLRLAKQWAKKDHLPNWDHYGNASREIMRLMLHVSYGYHEEMILSLNPAKKLWFHHVVDFGQLWSRVIQHEVELGKWTEAFQSLIMAGRGIPINPARLTKLGDALESIQEAKDFSSDEFFGWEIFARASNFDELIEFLWGAHVSAKILSPRFSRTYSGFPIKIAQNESTGARLAESTSINGLLARGATGLITESVECRGKVRKRPFLASAVLSDSMAKLQQLAIHYSRRRREFLRPIAATRSVPGLLH